MNSINIRHIQPTDNIAIAKIIRNSLEEFNANKPGTAYFDHSTDHLFETHNCCRSAYFVADNEGQLLGGCGIYPSPGLPVDTCELVKLYVKSAARGKGIGQLLIERCFHTAVNLNYKRVYLETLKSLHFAIPLYEKNGFYYLPASLGNSGHTACNIWMIKNLKD